MASAADDNGTPKMKRKAYVDFGGGGGSSNNIRLIINYPLSLL